MSRLIGILLFFVIVIVIHIIGHFTLELCNVQSLTDWKDFLMMPLIITFILGVARMFTKNTNCAGAITAITFFVISCTLVTSELISPTKSLEGWDYILPLFNTALCSFFELFNCGLYLILDHNVIMKWILLVYGVNVIGMSFYIYFLSRIANTLHLRIDKRFTTKN